MLYSSAYCGAVVDIVVHCPDTGVTENGRFGTFLVFSASEEQCCLFSAIAFKPDLSPPALATLRH